MSSAYPEQLLQRAAHLLPWLNARPGACRSLGQLTAGQYFGEYSCLTSTVRTATIVAASYCELYSLTRKDLQRVLQEFPELVADFDKLSKSGPFCTLFVSLWYPLSVGALHGVYAWGPTQTCPSCPPPLAAGF